MSTTSRGAFPYPDAADNWKQIRAAIQALADRAGVIGALWRQSTAAARGAAGNVGTFHHSSDTGVLGFDTGSAWVDLLPTTGKAADSDKLDGLDSTAFLPVGGKAADSDKLDGLDSTAFLPVGGTAADSNLLDGVDSTGFLRSANYNGKVAFGQVAVTTDANGQVGVTFPVGTFTSYTTMSVTASGFGLTVTDIVRLSGLSNTSVTFTVYSNSGGVRANTSFTLHYQVMGP